MSAPHDEYKPVYVIELQLESGPVVVSTRDVEIVLRLGIGFGQGGFGQGPFGGGGKNS